MFAIEKEIKEAIELNREINNYNEDAALHHCPFFSCAYCEYIFGNLLEDCPCTLFSEEYVKKVVRKFIGEL